MTKIQITIHVDHELWGRFRRYLVSKNKFYHGDLSEAVEELIEKELSQSNFK